MTNPNPTPMNCSTCRYELSQCLDGRLPSGRRTAVLQHAEDCSACGAFWNELQAAQDLTLSLRSIEVGSDFRDGLWERIRAGEGTPAAVFEEPVSTATKLRYTLSGAAAAAVLLLGLTYVRDLPTGGSDDLGSRDVEVVADVAGSAAPDHGGRTGRTNIVAGDVATGGALEPRTNARGRGGSAAEHDGRLQPRRPDAQLASTFGGATPILSPKPLTLQVLARETALQIENSYEEAALGMRMFRDPMHDRATVAEKVLVSAREIHDFGELLLDLRERKRVSFADSEVDADLQIAVGILGQATESGTQDVQQKLHLVERVVAKALERRSLASLSGAVNVPVHTDLQEIEELRRLNTTRPEVFPKLFFVVGDTSISEQTLIYSDFAFTIHDACGPSWVVVRSELHENPRLRMLHPGR